MNRVLLIQLRQLGDILLTTPSIRALRLLYPDAQIDFLSHRMGRLILANNPDIDHLYTYSEDDSFSEKLALTWRLRSSHYNLVIDFMHNPRSALFSFVTRAPKRVAFTSRRRWAYTETFPHPKESIYIVREKFSLLSQLGLKAEAEQLILPWQVSDLGPYTAFKEQTPQFANAAVRIALSATHRRAERRWPLERYAKLSDRLSAEWGAAVVWFWGPGEKDMVEEAVKLCKESAFLAPATSFAELAALTSQFDLFIGNSNGPSHVAVACQTPSLQLHGPTKARSWSPLKERHQAVQRDTMTDIAISDVWQAILELQPYVKKMVRFREQNGDRMSWEQAVELL